MSVLVPEFSGCLWPVDSACFSDDWAATEESVKTRSLALASATLTRLTAGRVKACPITVRPYQDTCGCFVPDLGYPGFYGAFSPGMTVTGNWVNNCGPVCADPATSVYLPPPVGKINQVRVGGAIVPTTDYRLFQGNRLAYIGSGAGWPINQDVVKPDTAAGTFSVTYLNGYPVDALGAYAAGLLAVEFAKACTKGKCKLPNNVTSIVRQGVSMDIVSGAFPNGLTGIREIDVFVALWNPRGVLQPTTVWYPGQSRVSW